ncbi:MAG: hypothetical protein H7X97_09825 [Opitutaceae bacterium]|nr:hypothetical protein [Verrucomicrobiales bacterium]
MKTIASLFAAAFTAGLTARFIAYVLSPEGQTIVSKSGFVSIAAAN